MEKYLLCFTQNAQYCLHQINTTAMWMSCEWMSNVHYSIISSNDHCYIDNDSVSIYFLPRHFQFSLGSLHKSLLSKSLEFRLFSLVLSSVYGFCVILAPDLQHKRLPTSAVSFINTYTVMLSDIILIRGWGLQFWWVSRYMRTQHRWQKDQPVY